MITPSTDSDNLAARLDRLPAHLRDAVMRELERLGRSRRDRVGGGARLSLAIDSTADTITATLSSAGTWTAGVPPASLRPRRLRSQILPRRSSLSSGLAGIRVALETAAHQAFVE